MIAIAKGTCTMKIIREPVRQETLPWQRERAYLFYTDGANWEAVEWLDLENGARLIWWVAKGTGARRRVVATISNGVVIVSWEPLTGPESPWWSIHLPVFELPNGAGLPMQFLI